MRAEIEKLLTSGRTAYSISKASGVSVSVVQRLISGEHKLGNITLDTAEKLYKLATEE